MAILAALILGAVGLFGFGAGAAIWMGSVYGSNSGGTEMESFLAFGSLGCITGILLGVGLVFRFTGGPPVWAKGLMIGAASLTGLSVIVLSGLALAHPRSAPQQPYSILVFELELPAPGLVEDPSWGFLPENLASINSTQKTCSGDTCTFLMVINIADTFSGGSVTLTARANKTGFPVDLPDVRRTLEWSDWHASGTARFRYRVTRYEPGPG